MTALPPLAVRVGAGATATERVLAWDRPLVMGVVNVTPDSFSDGGHHLDPEAAVAHGLALVAAGADLLDLGGEATNPRARPVPVEVERDRVVPVIAALAARTDAVLSVDTTKAAVAEAAVAAGAGMVNDVSGGRFDPAMFAAVAASGAAYVCGHLRGASLAEVFAAEAPATWREVADELAARLAAMPAALRARTVVDPGLGFGKGDHAANLALCARSGELSRALGRPVLVGPSRKRFVARVVGEAGLAVTPAALDAGTVGACLAAVAAGAHVVRVHDVSLLRPALAVYTEIQRA
ncbi:MAG: dihydropteroate synthase [Kofleriaceae bacterium]|nr:dihydropteroate synthase [Kofleriaceae bacterium]MCL4224050.1 dihydropteroate synthase [Myxococcales bacterium]